MPSNQGHRSIYSCIIGLGRGRIRPLQTAANRSRTSYYSGQGNGDPNATKITTPRVVRLSPKCPAQPSCDGQQLLFIKRKSSTYNSARLISSPPLNISHDSTGRSISTAALLGRLTSPGLHAPQCRNTSTLSSAQSYPKSLQNVRQRELDIALYPGTRALSTTTANYFGAPGKGGGGGGGPAGPGSSNGTFRTHSYQFMNTSRNIFGHSDGWVQPMYDLVSSVPISKGITSGVGVNRCTVFWKKTEDLLLWLSIGMLCKASCFDK